MRISAYILLLLAAALPGQQPAPVQPAAQSPTEPLLRITVNLVQVDAVVTDSKGRHIADLKSQDFELWQDGKLQTITNFSFVPDSRIEAPIALPPARGTDRSVPATGPGARLKREDVRRTIALVVDDLALSFEGTVSVQDALKDFIKRQMQPGDLVAIVRTSSGIGSLQQFTSDKRLLEAAAAKVRFSFWSRVGVDSFTPIRDERSGREMMMAESRGKPPEAERERSNVLGKEELKNVQQHMDEAAEREYFTAGTLGAVQNVVTGMRALPGRKSVILFSENLGVQQREREPLSFLDRLRRLADQANRAAVVLYAVDPRGVVVPGFSAADDVHDDPRIDDPKRLLELRDRRRSEYFDSQTGLAFLANQTGGLFLANNNSTADLLGRAVDDQTGFYLLGYRPSDGTFEDLKKRKYHQIKVKVLRPGLTVRSRAGFLGMSDDMLAAAPDAHAARIRDALTSPFNSSDIPLRLSCWFDNVPKQGPMMFGMVHVDSSAILFTEHPDGTRTAGIELIAARTGADGVGRATSFGTFDIRLSRDDYQRVLTEGFVRTFVMRSLEPGAFQFRVIVRDTSTQRVGSASQFMDIPDLRKGRLALSGIVVSSLGEHVRQLTGGQTVGGVSGEGTLESGTEGHPAVRRFSSGQRVAYAYKVLNAAVDSKTQAPQLESQIRLYRDGQLVFASEPRSLSAAGASDLKHLRVGGAIQLGKQFAPGDYTLEIVVIDRLAKTKRSVATQWVDFELKPI
jgi:VWFA-related protein